MSASMHQIPPARAAALAAVEASLPRKGHPGQDIQAALDAAVNRLQDPRDKTLATELAYGFLRLKGRMDHVVGQQLSRRERPHPYIQLVLGMACYELLHLDSVPAHATLSWAVDAVKARAGDAPGKFANAVLRRVQSLGDHARQEDFHKATTPNRQAFLAAWHSAPEWLVSRWQEDYGPEMAEAFLRAQALQPLTGYRVNAARRDARDLFAALVTGGCSCAAPRTPVASAGIGSAPPNTGGPRLLPGAAHFAEFPFLGFLPGQQPDSALTARLEQDGLLTRQTPAVGDILSRLEARSWPAPVWDACAGRGGKTLALLEQGSTVWASDTNARRLRGLVAECRRLGLPTPPLWRASAARPPLKSPPALILLDAPCSGLGVLSRRPDTKWKRTPADISALAKVQAGLIDAAVAALPSGGLLAYMTCTLTRAENEEQAARIERAGCLPLYAPGHGDAALREFMWGGVWKKK